MPEVEELGPEEEATLSRNPPPPLDLTGTQRSTVAVSHGSGDDDIDDDLDETLGERLWALTEMFPEGLRNFSSSLATFSFEGSKVMYSLARSGMWVIASSATILALPIMFETERAQMEEQQIQQQRQILLGPNAAAAGSSGLMGSMPPIPQPK